MKQILTLLASLFFTVNTYAQQAEAQLLFEEAETLYNKFMALDCESNPQDCQTTLMQCAQKLDGAEKIVGEKPKIVYLSASVQKGLFDLFDYSHLYDKEGGEQLFDLMNSLRETAKRFMELKKNDEVDDRYREMYAIYNDLQQYPKDKAAWEAEIEKEKRKEEERGQAVLASFEEDMTIVEGGSFMMGGIYKYSNDDTKKIHNVTLSTFKIGKFKITQKQWQYIMGYNPSCIGLCENCPVTDVSWHEVQEFIQRLNQLTNKNYRLPTEAEWEYAARGGINMPIKVANAKKESEPDFGGYRNSFFYFNFNEYPPKILSYEGGVPNPIGIYNMTGTPNEWCADYYDRNYYSVSPEHNPKGPENGAERVVRYSFIPRNYKLPNHKRDCNEIISDMINFNNKYYSKEDKSNRVGYFSSIGFRLVLDN